MLKCAICGQKIWLQAYTRNAGGGVFHINKDECQRPKELVLVRRPKKDEPELSYPAGYRREE